MAQQTDIQLKAQSNTIIRQETVVGGITNEEVADILDNIIDSKIHITTLSNVDNTSDAQKVALGPIKTALDSKYDISNPSGFITASQSPVQSVAGKTGTISLTKADVNLSNVDNTSDLNKPLSVATSNELVKKVDKIAGKQLSTEDYSTIEKNKLSTIAENAQVNIVNSVAGKVGTILLTKSDVGLTNVDDTSDANKPVSTATGNALGLKESLSNKVTSLVDPNNTTYPTTAAVSTAIQDIGAGESFQADWDASTNTPTLTSSVGTEGHYYQVSVAGTTNLDGITSWAVGDNAIFKGGVWKKRQSFAVSSWAGKTGTVTPAIADIPNLQTSLNSKLESTDIANFETTTQLNTRDTANRDRGNHAGTQLAATVSDFQTTVSANIDVTNNKDKRTYPLIDENKLAGIQANATANAADASLRDRTTHTGSQPISSVTNLQTDLNTINSKLFLTDQTTHLLTPKQIQEGPGVETRLITDELAQSKIDTQIPLNNRYQLGLDSTGRAIVRTSNLPAEGQILHWNTTGIYGSPNSPLTGDIKINLLDARITDVYLYHKQATEPVWISTEAQTYVYKIGTYSLTELNVIRLERHSDHLFIAHISNINYEGIDIETGKVFDLFRSDNDLLWDELSTTGEIVDYSGIGNGTVHNPVAVQWVPGQVQRAINLAADTPRAYVVLPTTTERAGITTQFTWASWLNQPGLETTSPDLLVTDGTNGLDGGIFIRTSNSHTRMEIILDRNKVAPSSTTRLRLEGTVSPDTPFHCVFTYNGLRIRGYINGVFVSSTGVDYTSPGLGNSNNMIINSNASFSGGWGSMHHERNILYNRVLTDNEIKALYNQSFQYETV